MPNRLWKGSLHLGLMMVISAGWVTGVEPFTRSARPVLAQETNQDIGQTMTGRLRAGSETLSDDSYYNIHPFEAEAGQSFLIEMVSEEFDTYLILLDPEGNQIAENDDGENGTNAQIAITIPATGEYTILANSYGAGETGTYTITIRPVTSEIVQQAETRAEADRLNQQGIQQHQVSQFREALTSWETALQLYREIGDRRGEANALNNLGLAYNSLGEYQMAIDYYEQSLSIAREIGDRQGESYSLGNLGNAYRRLGEYERAIDHQEQSLSIAREIGDRQGETDSLGDLGVAYYGLSEYQRAIDYHEQSLSIARQIGDRRGEKASLGDLGVAYYSLGEYQRAIDYYEQSLSIAREIGDRQGEAGSLGNLGVAYHSLGEYQRAIDYQEQSLSINREIGDRQGEVNSLGNLGNAYYSLGEYQRAIDYQEQQLAIAREIGDRQGEADSLGNLGVAYYSLDEYQSSIDYQEQSLSIDREIDDRQGEANSLGNLGNAYYSLGEYQRAIGYQQQQLAIAREIGDRQGEADSLGNLGNTYRGLGEYQRAIDYQEQSLSIAREIGDRQGEADSLNNLGVAYLNTQQYAEAEDSLLAAVEILEVLRTSELPDASKISLFETQRRSYMLLQQVLIAQAKTNSALEVAERARARALVELLATRVSERTAQAIAIDPLSLTQIQQIAQQQNATLVSYSIINFQGSEPVLYIWVIQPTETIDFAQVPLTSENTNSALINPIARLDGAFYRGTPDATTAEVTDLRSALGVNRNIGVEWDGDAESTNRLRELHQLLIEPIAHLLPTDPEERVIFIPQGSLFLVPFAALQNAEGNYLIEQHTILTAPSIQTLALTRSLTNNQSQASINDLNLENTLIVGNPTMPSIWNPETGETEPLDPLSGAGQEAQAIAQFLNADYLTGNAATESQIRQRIESAQLIHLATHGLLEYGDPAASGIRDVPGAIALTPDETNDGFLTSAELYDLNLNANLVVLSACDTGRGNITGDGVIGLSRALISAGVPSVVVSLWSVPDAPTAELMTEFYRQLEQIPDKAQALRQAMLITMQTHPDPRDWAAFTLIGEAE